MKTRQQPPTDISFEPPLLLLVDRYSVDIYHAVLNIDVECFTILQRLVQSQFFKSQLMSRSCDTTTRGTSITF